MSEAARTILQTNTEAARETAGEADPGFLWDFWYPALRSTEITGNKLVTAMLLEVPLVLGRTSDGKAFAMRDSCPHRGMPLSYGRFDGQAVECSYHGWRFDACSGRCVEIPSLTNQDKLKVERIFAGHLPCEECDGYVWVYMTSLERRAGDSARLPDTIPAAPPLLVFSDKYEITHLSCKLPSHIDHGIIGLMDPAHGPFVHQAWWWRSKASIHEKTKHFEPLNDSENRGRNAGFRMSSHAPSANSAPYKLLGVYGEPITTTIDFVLPNRRYETIRAGEKWFASLTTVTPVTASTCRIDVCAAWNVFYWVPFVTPIATFFGARFVRQDQQTMIEQAEGLRFNPGLMLIDDADKPAKWYFALKQARLKGTGEHPLSGPVTLHWRS